MNTGKPRLRRNNHGILDSATSSAGPSSNTRSEPGHYKCPQCPPGRKLFKTEQGMRDHLSSGVHGRENGNGKTQSGEKPGGAGWNSNIQGGWTAERRMPMRPMPDTPYRTGPVLESQFSTIRESVAVITRAIRGTQRLTLEQIFQEIDPGLDETQVLVLSLGQDTINYTGSVFAEYSSRLGITSHTFTGFTEDARAASCGAQIISGSLYRTKHLIEYRRLRLEHLKLLVLNKEASLLDPLYYDLLFDIHRYLRQDIKIACAYIGVWTGKPGQFRLSLQSLGLPDHDGRDQKEVEKQEKISRIALGMVKRSLGAW